MTASVRRAGLFARDPQFPLFAEEIGANDLARVATARGRPQVDNRPVGQLGNLPGIIQIVVLTKREAAVENDVALRIQRVRINHDQGMLIGRIFLCPGDDRALVPANRQFRGDLFEDCIRRRVAP